MNPINDLIFALKKFEECNTASELSEAVFDAMCAADELKVELAHIEERADNLERAEAELINEARDLCELVRDL